MSIESSVSETTPLRRPESQSSGGSEDPVSDITPTRNAPDNNATALHLNRTNSGAPTNALTPTAATTVAIANHNNNRIEVRLGHNLNGADSGNSGSNSHTHSNNNNIESVGKMETNKRILYRVGLDVLLLLCVGFPILCFFLWGDPYKRGFFCDDESLMHPFKPSTVKSWMLYIVGLMLPIAVIIALEIIHSRHDAQITNGNATTRRYVLMEYEIPDWMVECYKKIGIFGFGAAACQLATDIAKYSIGRLRPHFFTVCQPIMADGSTCANPINAGKYIQDFRCQGTGSSERMLKEMRLSFPSGHSSFTFFTMIYLALYLHTRMTWRGSKLLRHFLQFLCIMIAWYTALSRVSDYKHHWSDVLAGAVIGSLSAVVVANYVSDLFQAKSTKSYVLPRTVQDMPPQTITVNGNSAN